MNTGKCISFSPAGTLVPTYECFNQCSYCNFRVNPGTDTWLSLEQAEKQLQSWRDRHIIEALILSGEVHPRSPRRTAWFQHIVDLCQLALDMGLLPHTNAGPLSYDEMAQLRDVNVSMGLMLEQVTPALTETVHRHAPSKVPEVRLQQLEWAGELRIPFTTGLLLGIGESQADWQNTLEAIAQIHHRWGHIQEVILQPHSPGQNQPWPGEPLAHEALVEAVRLARHVLPNDITLQIPPNLVASPEHLFACLEAGASDLGGVSPKDEVNPDYPHPQHIALEQMLAQAGWSLQPRLPIYPQFDGWLPLSLQRVVQSWRQQLENWA
ncbi:MULTISPECIES: 7,8-didemethyl-8-hydroxy-5-deazariboflavin synthase subunit CofG [unclassified Leptolyngbya]|uniref:7,8-didemethyl-8-hydroxy-5-deazariboflavin synthase subunit CofG n=1 Tax=unclassified Leptolyngbya TaxID=2650499 RepID=UPI001683FB90|nr:MULTISPECIES: 7,8-didemethyl-8-hydroxy-5-deazariboflavin synthase subunit CofG [unclassified Leptolyngbya]MBD1911541.1 7,8-didemethyl-8-hydroxy-5-deazariboflavin synthase subunit CofG [Leptolyngbya sp. FACHB-8]MBD2155575.1 7,8-didemethyl-8-hydroxy-5-deazariboflavin synthase subunit CofG [Leptolyngbya sp. FACHB-16]